MEKIIKTLHGKRLIVKLITVVLGLFSAGGVGANVPVRDWWGDEVKAEPAAVFVNPARLGFYSRSILQIGLSYRLLNEERARLVYDQFENTVGEAVYADNFSSSWRFGPVAGIFRYRNFGFGAGVGVVRDFNYQYLKERLDDFYVKIGEDRVEQSGMLKGANLGISFNPVNRLGIGIGARYLFGSREFEQLIIRVPDTVRLTSRGKPSGVGWLAGIGTMPFPKLKLDFAYQSSVRLNKWDSTGTRIEPWRAVAGVELAAAGSLPSKFMMSAQLTGWSVVDSGYKNVLSVRLGVEHLMLNSVRLRYGFGLEPSFSDPGVQMPYGEFGLGFNIDHWRIDLGLTGTREELAGRNFVLPITPEDSRVYQTRINLSLGMQYEL